jgi:predicted nuclease of predicted toxin-antitoxin system
VRLLLDAHVSGRRIGTALAERGHDVLAVNEDRALDGCADADLLELAAVQDRVLVTFDAADFPRLCRARAEAGMSHAGCVVLVGIRHHEYGAILRALEVTFAQRPDPDRWRDCLVFASRSQRSG